MGKLVNKYAVVTGGGKGIGASIVERFLEDGVQGIAVLEWDVENAQKSVSCFEAVGTKILVIQCDVSDETQVSEAIKQTVNAFGRIDILVNNAGITRDAIFHKMTKEQWDSVISVNLNGVYHLCKYVIPLMRQNEYGRIVNLASISAFGNAGQANYAASKGAIIGLTKTLAKEGGPKNITVNCIAPGYIQTDMYNAVPEEIIEQHKKLIPLKRFGNPCEIASVASFLASDDASYVSGQCLVVSGGSI